MGSLFDVADAVFQSKNATGGHATRSTTAPRAEHDADIPTLLLLDETLRQIQDSRTKSALCFTPPNVANNVTSEPWKYKADANTEPESSALGRGKQSIIRHSHHPLRRVFSNILTPSDQPEQCDSRVPSPLDNTPKDTFVVPTSNQAMADTPASPALATPSFVPVDAADATARAVLKAIAEDMDAFEQHRFGDPSIATRADLANYIDNKYARGVLATAASTPFVELARKKVARRVEALRHQQPVASPPVVDEPNPSRSTQSLEEFGNDIRAALRFVRANGPPELGTTPQHPPPSRRPAVATHVPSQPNATPHPQAAIVAKLMKLPKSHMEKLPKAQRELVEFSKRYQQALELPPDKLAALPTHQQQFIHDLRSKVPQPST
ncbi:hypothetical protein H310_06948 [Aphanomyces invadans]|uniref:Uncharacterized protein n=1 Tax=Aphanomyces invadans TaxID=157072 RepID=A0A024U5A8_9STRA|nr:hypothetical protein H310_06948 [Aphanomyces invadans]ETW01419.1 hypothetical protein H310_06948 [Aphanomyces invadans]|eukprot:XP_008870417.1 hypothetical protein H310_06948 [Aphanomyces invadans]